jgi:hypothetical protein
VEPGMLANLPRAFYEFGMLVKEQLDIAQPLITAFQDDIAANRSAEAKNVSLKYNLLKTSRSF